MLTSHAIRNWLLRQPHAREIRLTCEGDVEMVQRGTSWAKCAETIHAKQPELIELLDDGGRIIRAIRAQEETDVEQSAPEPPPAIANDANAAMLTHFANLLHRAYEHSTTVAFSKMVEVVEHMQQRSDVTEERFARLERAHAQLIQERIDDAFDRADEIAETKSDDEGLALGTLAKQFAASALTSSAAGPTNGKGT